MANTILLKCLERRIDEGVAAAALSPGHLITFDSAGKVKKHDAEGASTAKRVALEDALQGKTIADAYAADDIVNFHTCDADDRVQMYLKAGENVAVGDKLMSAGDGTLKKLVAPTEADHEYNALFEAKEALNLTAGGAVATLIDVRAL